MRFLKEKNDLIKIGLLGFFALLTCQYYTYLYFRKEVATPAVYTHYLFNYQDEFVKRGLVGEILRQLGFQMSHDVFYILAYSIFFLVCISLIIAITYPFRGYWRSTGCLLFFLFVFFHPGTIQHFHSDFGRTDGINLILTLLCLFLVSKIRKPYINIPICLLMIIVILIHEATLFMYVPLVLAFSFYLDSSKENVLQLVILASILLLTTYIVSTHGLVKNSTLEQHYTKLKNMYGACIEEDSAYEICVRHDTVAILHDRGIKKNINLVIDLIKNKSTNVKKTHKRIFILLWPTFLIYILLIYEEIKRNGYSKKLLVFVAALGPLALYPLAYDFSRWWALAVTNLIVSTALIAGTDHRFRNLLISFFYRYQILVVIAIAISVKLGPLQLI
ncbi:hypothetical protein [Candidatus Nitrosacidococcus tergens]|uniref:Uncharacterized protein n=1 Tax=Candidatus Nitrosacidococcus tergens TaxID=553981 RepID=A0A7G1Q976_9GAMM|nr:hypothetical protein [Candidatus Nitrosacidococcus tergens]CAB1275727.1 membrane protein of unknown function [Candidatus Nitrosacidococcus tergens]